MTNAGVGPRVVGRDEELEHVRAFAAAIDRPKTLAIVGEPGIGKTTVWREGVAAAHARGSVVLTSQPSEVETSLSFSAVSDLLEDAVHQVLPELPPPQREALEVALLLREGGEARPERRPVATAFLGGLRVLARRGPVLIAIDDVQWLDRPSAAVIDFAVRRLREEPVAVLFSVRQGAGSPLDADERVTLGPLSLGALHSVLRDRVGSFPRPLLRRMHEAASGNPYFALELAAALLRRESPPLHGEALPVPESLDELLRERLAGLPPAARRALPVVAALSEPSVGAIEAVLPQDASLDAAVRSGALVVEGERVRFAHPLLASFVYAELAPQERRRLHRKLAAHSSEPEQRARHLALGTRPPDAEVASELDAAGARAAAHGAADAAAELAEHALRFTPAERTDDLVRRRGLAGEYHFTAGDTARAREMFESIVADETGTARAKALVHLAEIVEATEGHPAAAPLYRQALAEAGDDPALCAVAHWRLAGSVTSLGEGVPAAAAHARAAIELAERAGDQGLLALALAKACLYDFYLGRGIDRAAIERALSLEDEIERVGMWLEERPSTIVGAMTMLFVDFEAARARFQRLRELAEESGNERALPAVLFWLSRVAMRGLSFEEGRALAREGADLAQQTGQEQIRAQLLFSLSAAEMYAGRVEEARAAGRQGLAAAERTGDLDGIVNNLHALGLIELMLENHADADRHFSHAVEIWESLGITEPRAHSLIPDAVEAAAAVDPGRAEALLVPYERHARELGEGWPLAAVARCRGHLALARGEVEEAIAQLEQAASGREAWAEPEIGRTLLALGHAQRRARRKGEARQSLDRAAAIFERLGAPLWLARVRAELARIGGRRASGGGLTPTEKRIAELVAEGRSNKEVAAALHVSPRTVEGHLTHVYEKLGVRSRAALAHRLGGGQTQGVSRVQTRP